MDKCYTFLGFSINSLKEHSFFAIDITAFFDRKKDMVDIKYFKNISLYNYVNYMNAGLDDYNWVVQLPQILS